MVLAFPPNPTLGQVYQLWTWDGQKWVCSCAFEDEGGGGGNGVIGMPSKMIVFTANGIYTPTAGITSIMVECVGGGGAGGNVPAAPNMYFAGGGGGSGGCSRSVLLPAQIGASQLVTIGAGGVPAPNGTGIGGNGGATSFGTLVVANGGEGGDPYNGMTSWGQGGGGAAVGSGTFSVPGTPGESGFSTPTPQNLAYPGTGGSLFGGAAAPGDIGGGLGYNGAPAAANTGAGGGGAACTNPVGTLLLTGGNGGSGYCVVTEHMPA